MRTRLWRFLNTDIRDLFSLEGTVSGGIEAAQAVLGLAEKLQEEGENIEQLAPLVVRIDSLLDVLNSPLTQLAGAGLPFVSMATGILKFYLEATKHKPTLVESVVLVLQVAYLESCKEILNLPSNESVLERIGSTPVSEEVSQQIKRLGELELEEKEAREALFICFHSSPIAEKFNQVLSARLQQAGLEAAAAETLTQRVAWNTPPYLQQAFKALTEAGGEVSYLAQQYHDGWRKELEKYDSIEEYLETQIAKLPQETVFDEEFSFADIYVPLKAKPVDRNGNEVESTTAFVLEEWAKEVLQNPSQQGQVMFIQGAPGRGKSVFCRLFADWVRQNLHPVWTPILIRLRDIDSFATNFGETLQAAVDTDFAKNDDGWLTDKNTRYLFLLDGFDELRFEGRASGGIERFFKQVGVFQENCQRNPEQGHRVIVTGRSLALQGMEGYLPDNLERVKLQAMDEELQEQWLEKWEKVASQDKANAFRDFLRSDSCPQQIKTELAREPLLLYLLAAMHRDDKLQTEQLQEAQQGNEAKILIYEESLNWVLTKQREKWLQKQITRFDTDDLESILTEAGLCVVQSGGEYAKVRMIEARLEQQGEESAREILQQARKQGSEAGLKNALAAFYLKPAAGDTEGGVEFFHKSFSEFLFAKRLRESMEDWTQPRRRGKGFNLNDEQLAEQIYDILGYGSLTQEIVEYLIGLLSQKSDFSFLELFQRLENFYFRWCEGEFIDAPPENFPQKKMRLLQEQIPHRETSLGLRQVDIYAGLNVLILLLELQRIEELKEKVAFHPCGQPDTEDFDSKRLLKIISYSDCLGIDAFSQIAWLFLDGANLSGVYLSGANFTGADLNGANFMGANFMGADLNGANFTGANLIGANFTGANLIGVNLSGVDLSEAILSGADLIDADLSSADLIDADLIDADLSGVNLRGANLIGANFMGANFMGANLSDKLLGEIRWDENTNWESVQGLETAENIPEELRQQLGI